MVYLYYIIIICLERLPRACSGPRTPNDSLVKRRITLSSSPLAKLEGRENFLPTKARPPIEFSQRRVWQTPCLDHQNALE